MPQNKRKIEVKTVPVGGLVDPIITVSDVPAEANVGDKITPKVLVERTIGTPIVGAKVDFFVEDTLVACNLGVRQTTDADGEATASEPYYVGSPEESQTLKFVIVVHRTTLP